VADPLTPRPSAEAAASLGIPPAPAIDGAAHLHSGKVRDLYRLEEGPYAGHLLMVASDRISAYDHVLSPGIPDKGEILTRMSLWWFDQLADLVPGHVVSSTDGVPAHLRGRALVCRPLTMHPVECVARGYLTGSGLEDYRATGEVCGIALPPGLTQASRLPEPIFTPATKAELGDHDENVSFEAVAATVGTATAETLREVTLAVYARAESIARERGILLADTKIELGTDDGHATEPGRLTLGDEVLTPDSSRYWPADAWEPGATPPAYDKQVLRDWLTGPESGWDRTGEAPPPELPERVVDLTRQRYVEAYERLTGQRF